MSVESRQDVALSQSNVPVERQGSNLCHLCARRAPGVVTCGCIPLVSRFQIIERVESKRSQELQLRIKDASTGNDGKANAPFRTLIWTDEYPFVTFLTLRTTFDIFAVICYGTEFPLKTQLVCVSLSPYSRALRPCFENQL